MIECPSCRKEWPEDRFNGVHAECFKCRVSTLRVGFGTVGRDFFHNTTIKEYNDHTVKEARKNGIDAVPLHSAGNPVAAASIKKLEVVSSGNKEKVGN